MPGLACLKGSRYHARLHVGLAQRKNARLDVADNHQRLYRDELKLYFVFVFFDPTSYEGTVLKGLFLCMFKSI